MPTTYVIQQQVHIRRAPNIAAAVIGTLKKDELVQVLDVIGDDQFSWCRTSEGYFCRIQNSTVYAVVYEKPKKQPKPQEIKEEIREYNPEPTPAIE